MLYIGEIRGGPELDNAPIINAISRLFSLKGSDGPELGTSLDIVFQIPGSVFSPEFEGVRTGRFSRKEQILQIQIAVPKEMVYENEDDALSFCFEALRTASGLAAERLKKAKAPFNEAALRDLIARVEARAVH